MNTSELNQEQIYNYNKLDGTVIKLKYWYETINYFCFTTVDEKQTIILLYSAQIINNITEIEVTPNIVKELI